MSSVYNPLPSLCLLPSPPLPLPPPLLTRQRQVCPPAQQGVAGHAATQQPHRQPRRLRAALRLRNEAVNHLVQDQDLEEGGEPYIEIGRGGVF